MMMFNVLNAATWGDMAKEKEKAFSTSNSSPGWPGHGKQPLSFYLSLYV